MAGPGTDQRPTNDHRHNDEETVIRLACTRRSGGDDRWLTASVEGECAACHDRRRGPDPVCGRLRHDGCVWFNYPERISSSVSPCARTKEIRNLARWQV